MVRAVEVPLYRLFHDGEAPASLRKLTNSEAQSGKPITSPKLGRLLAKMEPDDQKLLLHMAQKVARG